MPLTPHHPAAWHNAARGLSAVALVTAATLSLSGPAAAQPAVASAPGWSLHLGAGSQVQRLTLNYETAVPWSHRFDGGLGRVDLAPEFGVSVWHASGNPTYSSSLLQFSAIPMLRWWTSERFFLEGGIGATLISRTRFADKDLSTSFQFGDHLGLGYQMTGGARIGLRMSHFSNAGIKKPNPGLDLVQLTYSRRF